jgi:hypothetical protein
MQSNTIIPEKYKTIKSIASNSQIEKGALYIAALITLVHPGFHLTTREIEVVVPSIAWVLSALHIKRIGS